MDRVRFSAEELERLTVKQLRELINYYNIPFSGRLKQDHVDVLLDYYRPVVAEEPEQQMSVRIRRIKESMQ